RADRRAVPGAAAGADAEVHLQLLERRGGHGARQVRGRDQVAPAPRARLAAETTQAVACGAVALEVGIVGPSGSGKTSLFTALTKTGGGEYGKTNVGMSPIADERLAALAGVVHAKKVTPAAIRVQDVPGTGPALLGNLRQVDALLVVLDGFSAGADPAGDLETLRLELLVADRDHVERRLERVEK